MSQFPEKFPSVCPMLTVSDAAAAIELYKKTLGATEIMRMPSPDGSKIMHAELQIGDSIIFLHDENKQQGCIAPQGQDNSIGFYVYVDDVDVSFQNAITEGYKEEMVPEDMFWGDRIGGVIDPFGYKWTFAKNVKKMTPEEVEEAMKQMGEAA